MHSSPFFVYFFACENWIPAYAGMTEECILSFNEYGF